MVLLFWLVLGFVALAFVGVPVAVALAGVILRREHRRDDVTPSVSILIAAYNEADGIVAKVRNALGQDYPPDRLEVVVVDDGSADDTGTRVRAIDDPRLTLIVMPERGGKVTALNHGIRATTGEVVVYTDANAEFAPDAVRRLVRAFADPEVGGVCGNQENRPGRGALARGETLYWEFDKALKRLESRTGSIVAADGSIYALRREHVEEVPLGVTDDFFLSTGVVRQGKRLVFEADARSIEEPLEREGDHFRRRVRITHQAMRSLAARRQLLDPRRYGVYAWVLIGHKLLRRLAAPAILLLLPVSLLAAPSGGVPLLALIGQVALYVAAALGWLAGDRLPVKLLAAPTYFVLGILGTTVGIWRFLRGERSVMWEPVRR